MSGIDRDILPTIAQAKVHYREVRREELEADLKTVEFEIAWEERLAKEAIKKERKEEKFLEPTPKQIREREEAEARWPLTPPVPEPIRSSPKFHFEGAAKAVTRDQTYEPPKQLRGMSVLIKKTFENSKEGTRTKDVDEYLKLPTFAEALERSGVGFARATKEEAERSHRESAFARALGNYAPSFRENEIVAVRAWCNIKRGDGGEIIPPGQRVYKLDQKAAKGFVDQLGIENKLQGIDPTKKTLAVQVQSRATDESAKWREIRFNNATRKRGGAQTMGDKGVLASVGLTKSTGRLLGKTLDTFADMIGSIAAPVLTPERIAEGEIAKQQRTNDAEQAVDLTRFTTARSVEIRQSQDREARGKEREVEREL